MAPALAVGSSRHVAAAPSAETEAAIQASRQQWLTDLKTLLTDAQRRFADVSWRTEGDDEIIYGHKALLYARANAAFQTKYLNPNGNARLQAIMSGSNFSLTSATPSSPNPLPDFGLRAVSPGALSFDSIGNTSEGHGQAGQATITLHGTESAFFRALLDFLYTASTDISEVFTFLFEDSAFALSKENATDKLSQDLLFAWRSKLFADVQIKITDAMGEIPDSAITSLVSTSEGHHEEDGLFATHRAILSVRCPYFTSIFLSPYSDTESALYSLPSPPFTPAALHFILAYIYTGSLTLPRTFDLATAMQIWRCASYLSMELLQAEVVCRIGDMCHGYSGCCKTCRMRATRVFAFGNEPDVNDKGLQSSSKPILIDHFGEVWGKEVGELPYTIQREVLMDLCASTNAHNAAARMKGICAIRARLAGATAASGSGSAWPDHLRSMLVPLEDRMKHLLRYNFGEIAVSASFVDLLEGVGFSNDVLEALLTLLVTECLIEKNVAQTYEILVGKVLLREEGIMMDASARVEDARRAILQWIKKRWVGVRSNGGFDKLENWCLKELSDELEQPIDDLLQSTPDGRATTKTGLRVAATKIHKVSDENIVSGLTGPSSLRASVLNRNAARKSVASSVSASGSRTSMLSTASGSAGARGRLAEKAAPNGSGSTSVPAVAVVGRQRVTSASGNGVRAKSSPRPSIGGSTPPVPATPTRPGAVPLPAQHVPPTRTATSSAPSTRSPTPSSSAKGKGRASEPESGQSESPYAPTKKPVSAATMAARARKLSAAKSENGERPKSSASVRSTTSTSTVGTSRRVTSASDEAPTAAARPASIRSLYTRAAVAPRRSLPNSPAFKPDLPPTSSPSLRNGAGASIHSVRPRVPSTGSIGSPISTKRTVKPGNAASSVPPAATKRPASVASVASTRTTGSAKSTDTVTTAKKTSSSTRLQANGKEKEAVPPLPKSAKAAVTTTNGGRKFSATASPALAQPSLADSNDKRFSLPGSTLRVGIPCVVTSGTIKFRATVRYLGEVMFDQGKESWVGVEVAQADSEGSDRENWEWNDGTVDGIKYFELESRKPRTPMMDRLHARDEKRSGRTSTDGRRTPVPGGADSGPSKGLFVHPSQVLYVF